MLACVDYAALGEGGVGSPKQPTFTVGWLVDGEYEAEPGRAKARNWKLFSLMTDNGHFSQKLTIAPDPSRGGLSIAVG